MVANEFITDVNGGNIYLKKTSVTYPSDYIKNNKILTISEEFDLGTSKPPIINIIRSKAVITSNDKKVIANKLIVKGEICVNMLYTYCNDNCDGIETMQFTMPFSQVIDMEGVDDSSKLTDYEEVLSYLAQNVPVPYDPKFTWGKEIVKRLKAEGYYEPKYNVFLTYGDKTIPVYKPYQDEFLVDKTKNIIDKILDINIVKLADSSDNLIAIGWLAKTSYLGSIYDRSVKGIRLRKGNILIGDHQTLNVVFKDARFNG